MPRKEAVYLPSKWLTEGPWFITSSSTKENLGNSSGVGTASGGGAVGASAEEEAGRSWEQDGRHPRVVVLIVHEGPKDMSTGEVFEDTAQVVR
jgi:hypothetical protein